MKNCIIITTNSPIKSFKYSWSDKNNTLLVSFVKKKISVTQSLLSSDTAKEKSLAPSELFSKNYEKRIKENNFTGTLNDFINEFRNTFCTESKIIEKGLKLCENNKWAEAYDVFDVYIKNNHKSNFH